MFFFKNRQKYNGKVDGIITEGYRIATRDNDKFPGLTKYLELLDACWAERYTEQEAAMFVAALYYSGLMANGYLKEASALMKNIAAMGHAASASGEISANRMMAFMAHIEVANKRARILE